MERFDLCAHLEAGQKLGVTRHGFGALHDAVAAVCLLKTRPFLGQLLARIGLVLRTAFVTDLFVGASPLGARFPAGAFNVEVWHAVLHRKCLTVRNEE